MQENLENIYFPCKKIRINCSSDLKNVGNSWPSASNFKSFSQALEQLFLIVGQNNFVKKIPFVFQGRLSSISKQKSEILLSSIFLTSYDFRSDNGLLSNSKIGDAGKFIRNVGIIKPINCKRPVVILFCFCPVLDL